MARRKAKLARLSEALDWLEYTNCHLTEANEAIGLTRESRQRDYREGLLEDAAMELETVISDCRSALNIVEEHLNRLRKQDKKGRK
jgi:hypothetical protein